MIKPTFAIVLGVLAPGVETFSTAQKLTTNPPGTGTVTGVTALNNLTGSLSETLFTPLTTGVYRVTYYSQVTGGGSVVPAVSYTNGLGVFQSLSCQDCFQGSGGDACFVRSFQARGGTPVLLQITNAGTGVQYSVSITIERLETTPKTRRDPIILVNCLNVACVQLRRRPLRAFRCLVALV
jgi:hypothetical protein